LINKAGKNIAKQSANHHIGGYFLALDLTDRNLQKDAKAKGFPW
jgi:acylpyruvate hydrolase